MTVPKWTLRLDGSTLPPAEAIGGKAWSVARMMALGLPVPPAFVITTEACRAYQATGTLPPGLLAEIREGIADLEARTGQVFGGTERPLLVSVRSGAPVSMPGMMDTVLNLGIDAATERALARLCGDAAFARDTHRRFYDMFGHIVLKAPAACDPDAGPEEWNAAIRAACGEGVPDSLEDRLIAAVRAVFESWNGRRAKRYRQHHGIDDAMGTAVTIQAMVFGNLDDQSGTGVLFTRNPLTGARVPYGEYLPRAQGEDVVSGRFTPRPLSEMAAIVPAAHAELLRAGEVLEHENADMQDVEFTVQQGILYLLQSRAGKRAPEAAVAIAVDMVDEGLISPRVALTRVAPDQVRQLLAPRLAAVPGPAVRVLASGEGASPGVGRGVVVTDADEAERRAGQGEAVVLVRPTTSPEDVHGMIVARAVVTETGGATSHAAVVGRALGLPAVVGCGAGLMALAGQAVTVDGGAGKVYAGLLDVVTPREGDDPRLARLAAWARPLAPLDIRPVEEAPPGIRDLAHVEGGEDPARIAAALTGAVAVRGGAIGSDAGIAAAVAAGVRTVYCSPVLPALLAAVRAKPEAE
jgi:pyruvate,orthophosphate dikinase